ESLFRASARPAFVNELWSSGCFHSPPYLCCSFTEACVSSKLGDRHNLTVPSPFPENRTLPSPENTTAQTLSASDLSVANSRCAATLQSLTVPSPPLEARVLPSGEKATELTVNALCPGKTASSFRFRTFQ